MGNRPAEPQKRTDLDHDDLWVSRFWPIQILASGNYGCPEFILPSNTWIDSEPGLTFARTCSSGKRSELDFWKDDMRHERGRAGYELHHSSSCISRSFLTISLSASAAMYKCTDTKGNVSFSDKACPTDRQEVLKKRTPSNQPDGVQSNPSQSARAAGSRSLSQSNPSPVARRSQVAAHLQKHTWDFSTL